ncbi:MAG: isochorismatase family protein [Calditrichaeota bacterium]|nr:MAG: isochorismatase family protein [Calditrichota bacterium]
MLKKDKTALVFIDIQGKLAQIVYDTEILFLNLQRMAKGAQVLDIPIIWMQQNPAGLGETIPELREALPNHKPINKMSFSCCGDAQFNTRLAALNCTDVLLAGIESHVCVYLTAADLQEQGYQTHVIADAVSSRTAANKQIGIDKIRECGGKVTCVETTLLELLNRADGPEFKQILRLIK